MIGFVLPFAFSSGGAIILSLTTRIDDTVSSAIIFVAGIPYIAPTHSSAEIKSPDSDTAFSTLFLIAVIS